MTEQPIEPYQGISLDEQIDAVNAQLARLHSLPQNYYGLSDDVRALRAAIASLQRLRTLDYWKKDPLFEVFERSSLGLLVCVSASLSDDEIVAKANEMYPQDKYRIRPADAEMVTRIACLHHQGRFHMVLEAADVVGRLEVRRSSE